MDARRRQDFGFQESYGITVGAVVFYFGTGDVVRPMFDPHTLLLILKVGEGEELRGCPISLEGEPLLDEADLVFTDEVLLLLRDGRSFLRKGRKRSK